MEDRFDSAVSQSETDILLLAIAKEKMSFARLAAAAAASTDPKTRRVYNRLALDELKHLLTLVSVMNGLADDWLAKLDLTVPPTDLSDPLPQTEETILQFATEKERAQNFFRGAAERADREELLSVLDHLRADEEDHRMRLLALLYGVEADRPIAAGRLPAWLRSIRRMVPVAQLH